MFGEAEEPGARAAAAADPSDQRRPPEGRDVPDEVDEFQGRIPFFRSRALVAPGLTGWAQVNWGYGVSWTDEIEKLQYDLYYVGHQSLYLDLLIVLRTIQLLVRRTRPVGRPGPAAVLESPQTA